MSATLGRSSGFSMGASLHMPGLSISASSRSRVGGACGASSHGLAVNLRAGSASVQLSAFIQHSSGKRAGLSDMSRERKGAYKSPGLSDIIRKGFDAFNASRELYKSASTGGSKGFTDEQLAPMRREFSNNPERAQRQEAFVNTYMPHVKALSAFQSGMESVARKMLGIPDKPKKTTSAPPPWKDLGAVQRKTSSREGFVDQDQLERRENERFIMHHAPGLSPLLKAQDKLESSFRSLLGMPTKRPDQPNMGQKLERTMPANEERQQRSPMDRILSEDPARAQRQQAFLNKYMPHVAALSKLQSSLEDAVKGAIRGGKDTSVDPTPGVVATE